MRKRLMVAILLLAGCSKAPNANEPPDLTGNASAGVAFTYRYGFELPSRSIGELQEAHAQNCERAGVATCRINGLSYTVDRDGEAHASLSVKVASPIARRFGRAAIVTADRLGATLVGADITGEDVQPAMTDAATTRRTAQTDVATIDQSLAGRNLPAAERAQLRAERARRVEAARTAAASATSGADRLANTPMSFTYQPGHGVGLGNALRDSADAALSSTRTTLIAATWLVATLGPPAVLLLLLWLIWARWGRRVWDRAMGDPPA